MCNCTALRAGHAAFRYIDMSQQDKRRSDTVREGKDKGRKEEKKYVSVITTLTVEEWYRLGWLDTKTLNLTVH